MKTLLESIMQSRFSGHKIEESILSKSGVGIEQSIRNWIASTNLPDTKVDIIPVKGGYYVILDNFFLQAQLSTIYLDKKTAHNVPRYIRGVFFQHYRSKDEPDYITPVRFIYGNTSFTKFEIPDFDFTQRDDIKILTFFDPIIFSYSNTDEMVGSIKMNSDKSYAVKLSQSYVCKKISLNMTGNSLLYLYDGVVVNLHNIKDCKIHKLVIGDAAIAHTESVDRNMTKKINRAGFTRLGSHYFTNDYFTDLLKELESNNKIDVIEYMGDMIPSKRGQSVILSWRENRKTYIAK